MPHNENWSRSQAVFHLKHIFLCNLFNVLIIEQPCAPALYWFNPCICSAGYIGREICTTVYILYFLLLRFIFIDSSILYSVFFKNCIVLHCIETICICRGILGVKYVLHSLYYNLYSPSCNCSKGRLSAMQGILANLRLINLVIGLIIIIIILLVASIIRQRPHPQCHPNTKEHVVPIFVQEVLIRQWPLRGKSVWHSATRLMFF